MKGIIQPARLFIFILFALVLTGCAREVDFQRMPASSDSSLSGEIAGDSPGDKDTEGGVPKIYDSEEGFFPAVKTKKKIDILMLVDNSGSMGDDQAALASGFARIADVYFRNPDFDICIGIITSDRYLGRTGSGGYSRERMVGCTNPDGSENWDPAVRTQHWNTLISDFKTKVNVGTNGSSRELAGKSLATFLFNQDVWVSNLNTAQRHSFFRRDAIPNISIFTDENNYFYNNMDPGEVYNDIPHKTGAQIPGGAGAIDSRKGIKNYLDDYFIANVNSAAEINYVVLAMLYLSSLGDRSKNVEQLVDAVGRGSLKAEISGDPDVYENVYKDVIDELIARASAIKLAHAFYEPGLPNTLSPNFVVKAKGNTLLFGTDFTLIAPNYVILASDVLKTLAPADEVRVKYQYMK